MSARVKFALTTDGIRDQAIELLTENNIPVNDQSLGLFAAAVQHSDPSDDTYEPGELAAKIRKSLATYAAWPLIVAAREADKAKSEQEEKAAKPQGPSEEVVQKA